MEFLKRHTTRSALHNRFLSTVKIYLNATLDGLGMEYERGGLKKGTPLVLVGLILLGERCRHFQIKSHILYAFRLRKRMSSEREEILPDIIFHLFFETKVDKSIPVAHALKICNIFKVAKETRTFHR